jgi:hypothetical protein
MLRNLAESKAEAAIANRNGGDNDRDNPTAA